MEVCDVCKKEIECEDGLKTRIQLCIEDTEDSNRYTFCSRKCLSDWLNENN